MKIICSNRFYILLFFIATHFTISSMGQQAKKDNFLDSLLNQYPTYFSAILSNAKEYKIQILYTQIDRDKKGNAIFTDHSFNLNKNDYYYPASTVKLPIAVLALQKLNEL